MAAAAAGAATLLAAPALLGAVAVAALVAVLLHLAQPRRPLAVPPLLAVTPLRAVTAQRGALSTSLPGSIRSEGCRNTASSASGGWVLPETAHHAETAWLTRAELSLTLTLSQTLMLTVNLR